MQPFAAVPSFPLLIQNEPFNPAYLGSCTASASSSSWPITITPPFCTATTTTPLAATDRCTLDADALTRIAHQADVTVRLEAFQWQLDVAATLAALVSRSGREAAAKETIGIALGVLDWFESCSESI